MLTIIILLALGWSFYRGYRQGMATQSIQLVRSLVSFIVAFMLTNPLADFLEFYVPFPSVTQTSQLAIYDEATSFLLDQAFYRVLSFILVSLFVWLVTRFIVTFANRFKQNRLGRQADKITGGIISLLLTYIVLFVVLFTLSLLPIEWIQQQFVNNRIAYWMVTQSLGLTQIADHLWLHVTAR